MPGIAIQVVELREPEDRLSNLPDDLIGHILSFLPTLDVVRTCLVSKQWSRMWYTVPVFDFDEQRDMKKFCTFVNYCMKRRRNDFISDNNTAISRFRLAINPSWKIVHQWLKVVGMSNVQELDLNFYNCEDQSMIYGLRPNELPLRSLTHLSLTRVYMKGFDSLTLPWLVSLSLKSVYLDDQVLHGLLSGCRLLEKLLVTQCHGLLNPKFSSWSLKVLEIDSTMAQRILVESVNLESLVYSGPQLVTSGPQLQHYGPRLLSVGKLRKLSLSHMMLDGETFAGLISRLPCLESLTLNLYGSNGINICSGVLKHFNLIVDGSSCNSLRVKIDTPNLVYFSFKGSPMVDLSLKAQSILESNVEFCHEEYNLNWYAGLARFLTELDCSTNVNLRAYSGEAFIFPEELCLFSSGPLHNVKALKVVFKEPSMRRKDLTNSLLWMAGKSDDDLRWC